RHKAITAAIRSGTLQIQKWRIRSDSWSSRTILKPSCEVTPTADGFRNSRDVTIFPDGLESSGPANPQPESFVKVEARLKRPLEPSVLLEGTLSQNAATLIGRSRNPPELRANFGMPVSNSNRGLRLLPSPIPPIRRFEFHIPAAVGPGNTKGPDAVFE